MSAAGAIRWERGDDGVVVLTLDAPGRAVNILDSALRAELGVTVDRLERERDDIAGVVLASAKPSFCAGGDVAEMLALAPGDTAAATALADGIKADLRRLETLGRPVVAALGGAALGGGLQLALACHRRVIVDDPAAVVGFPEVTLGIAPGFGGVVRVVRMLGIVPALSRVLLDGARIEPRRALELGLVDELVADRDALLPAARAWIAANPDAAQPWDRDGYRIPGGRMTDPQLAQAMPTLPAALSQRLGGAPYPAPHAIQAAAAEGAQLDFDGASTVEGRYFAELVTGQTAKNMIQAFFFDMRAVRAAGDGVAGAQGGAAAAAGPWGDEAGDRAAALARTLDAAPDGLAARIVAAFAAEGAALLAEGVAAPSIERASGRAGFAVSALRLCDEVGLERVDAPGRGSDIPFEDMVERLLFAAALAAAGQHAEGAVESVAAANVESLLVAGFPAWTGGALQYVDGYRGQGPAAFVARAGELSDRYGDRFRPPEQLAALAAAGGRYRQSAAPASD